MIITWQDVGKLDDSWRMEDNRWEDGGARSKKYRKSRNTFDISLLI